MSIDADYGSTPLTFDELDALLPEVREALESHDKRSVYFIEQSIQRRAYEELSLRITAGKLIYSDLLTDAFLRKLHKYLYGEIWTWAGKYRNRELNIGIHPARISSEVRNSLDNIRFRWENTDDWDTRTVGIVTHAELVRIHPFTDGNGRSSRLLADLIYLSLQSSEPFEGFDWSIDKRRYIELLQRYDFHRDPTELTSFIPVKPM